MRMNDLLHEKLSFLQKLTRHSQPIMTYFSLNNNNNNNNALFFSDDGPTLKMKTSASQTLCVGRFTVAFHCHSQFYV